MAQGDVESIATAPKKRETTRADRGGPPLENPTEIHRRIAARDRLWNSYQGGGPDGAFVWTAPDGKEGPWGD